VHVARIFGIDVEIDWSWLLALLLFTWAFSGPQSPFAQLDEATRLGVAFACSVLLFVSVLIHELAHALLARRYRYPVYGIRLLIFGGISRIGGTMTSGGQEALIAFVGPLSTLIVALGCLLLAYVADSIALHELFLYLAYANVVLAIFNLLPAYPLDGGRVMHAISWWLCGSRDQATLWTVGLSRILGILLAIGGAIVVASGNLVSGVTLVVAGWLVIAAARAEWLRQAVLGPLRQATAAEIADPPLLTLESDATCAHAIDAMRSRRANVAPVVVGRTLLGLVTLEDLVHCESPRASVGSIMTRSDAIETIPADLAAASALDRLSASRGRALPVVDRGELLGFISNATFSRIIAYERTNRFRSTNGVQS
jgi:Zn-dependent protease/predicted transcriptional regulator